MNKKNIQTKTIKLYNKNLKFLKNEHPAIYDKITTFSDMISDGSYKETLFLEHINGYFNVYDKKSNNYVYETNHKDYSKVFKQNLNFKHDNGFNTLNAYAYSMDFNSQVKDEILHIRDSLAPFTNYINKNIPAPKDKKVFKYISKYIAIGTLLGYHLKKVKSFYNPSSILIIEPHIEMFRLSLFTFNYKKLAKNCNLYFSIMEDNITFHQTFSNFYEINFVENYFLKFHLTNPSYENILQNISGNLQYTSPFNFDHLRIINALKKTTTLIKSNYKFLNLKKFENKLFNNMPVLILGAGPSLQFNRRWLIKNHKKFLIVSVASAIPRLSHHNIKPDIIVSLDASAKISDQFTSDSKELLKDTPLLLSSMTHSKVFKHNNQKNTYIYEIISNIKFTSDNSLTATNVGEIAYALMLLMNVKNIYLLGLDAALNSKTGDSHDNITNIGNKPSHSLKDTSLKTNINMLDVVETRGNFTESVKTTRIFYNSILAMNMLTKKYKKYNQYVYNLSDGAYFKDTTPLKTNELNLKNFKTIDKKDLNKLLTNNLNINSSNRLTISERQYLKAQTIYIDSLIKGVKKFKKIQKFKNLNEYNHLKSNVVKALIEIDFNEENKTYLNKVFLIFLFIVEPYIYYFFNDTKLKNKNKHIKVIHQIWCEEVINVLKKYKDGLII